MGAKQKVLLAMALLAIGAMALLAIWAENGALDLMRLKAEHRHLLQANERLTRENVDLYRQIERLKSDPAYIESVARRELGLIRPDEMVLKSVGRNND